MSRKQRLGVMEGVAGSQHGYITRAQAQNLEVSDVDLVRLSKSGDLQRVEHGIYRFRGSGSLRWEAVWIAWLRLDPVRTAFERTRKPTEVVAGRTAASVYQIGDLDPEPYEFIVSERHQTRRPDIKFRTEKLARSDWEIVDGLPVTRPVKIIRDLFAQHIDVGHITDIAIDATLRGLLPSSELSIAAESSPYPDAFIENIRSGANG